MSINDAALARYLDRIGATDDHSLDELQRLHVNAIPYENLDVRLGRDVPLDIDSLLVKLVDRRRGGYCFELNTLFAALLEALGYKVTRCLARVRLGDGTTPRPETHMVLIVDERLVDVGFGGATPIGPLPIGGSATYGPWTWFVERTRSPEDQDVWSVRLFDLDLFTFSETPRHAVDYLAPNHWTSTHPLSLFRNATIVQRWADETQVGLVGSTLTIRRPNFGDETSVIDLGKLGAVLDGTFGLALTADDINQLATQLHG